MDRTYSLLGRPKIADADALLPRGGPHGGPGDAGDRPAGAEAGCSSRATSPRSSRFATSTTRTRPSCTPSSTGTWCSPGRWCWAPTRTPARTAAWAPSPSAWAARTSPRRWCSASRGSRCPRRSRSSTSGELPFGIGGKDVILKTLGDLKRNTVAMERTVEYRGEAVKHFSTDMRFTIANMTAEFGGLNGIFEADAVVAQWLVAAARARTTEALYFRADDDAPYARALPNRSLQARAAGGQAFSPDNVMTVEPSAAGTVLQGCFIGACTTTEEELVLAALVLEQAFKDQPARAASPEAAGGAGRPLDSGAAARGRPLAALREGRLPGRAAGLLDVPRRRVGEGAAGRDVDLVAEPQLREPHGAGLASPGWPRRATVAASARRR